MSWLGLLIGGFIAWMFSNVFGWREFGLIALGAAAGAAIGGLLQRVARLEALWTQRFDQLEAQLRELKQPARTDTAPAAADDVPMSMPPAPVARAPLPAPTPPAVPARAAAKASIKTDVDDADLFSDWVEDEAAARAGPDTVPMGAPAVQPDPADRAAARPRTRSTAPAALDDNSLAVTSSLGSSLQAWFQDGNTIVRGGVIILFVGVLFLLRYASQYVTVPIELRIAAVALGGVALTVLGWRLRQSRRGYALTLQGAGVGIVYITLFAAYRLYHLVPGGFTFVLLAVMAAVTALLAVLQNALPLAVFGFGGAFLAPVLASTGSGNHVALFSYYLLVNLAIAWIARRQAWKLLNLEGFVFTFGIGTAWGLRAYTEPLFASAELFLVLHFMLYLYIAVQYTRQLVSANETRAMSLPTVDGGLLFGVPIAAFGLQAGMLHGDAYALSASAAVMAAVYLLVGRWLWRAAGRRMLLLVEGLLALGVVFLILVTPLALDTRWTGIAWAVQGAGLVWVALRQQRAWAVAMGLALQLLAALAFWTTYRWPDGSDAFFNAALLGALVVAASALTSARLLWRATQAWPKAADNLQAAHWVMLGAGVAQALAALWGEVATLALPALGRDARAGLLLAAAVVLLDLVRRPLAWPALRICARVLLMLALLHTSLEMLSHGWSINLLWLHYVEGASLWSTLVLIVLGTWLLRRVDQGESPRSTAVEAATLSWFAMLHTGVFVYVLGAHEVARHLGWTPAAAMLGPTAIGLWLVARDTADRWPMAPHRAALNGFVLVPWLLLCMLWVLVVNGVSDASMQPLPYLPLLNPLDLAHGLLLLFAIGVRRAAALPRTPFITACGALGFWWLNGVLVRTLHHWADTPMWGHGALGSEVVQTALTILWSVTACTAMALAARRGVRVLWLTGAALLGVVVAKLFLVDLSNIGTLARIVSFIGVGLLMLLVGYVAPMPPSAAPKPREATP